MVLSILSAHDGCRGRSGPRWCRLEGWLKQDWRIAPISRIQTVDIERDPVEQLFRLAKITVTTASAAGPVKIAGLDRRAGLITVIAPIAVVHEPHPAGRFDVFPLTRGNSRAFSPRGE